jgi:hypothetical protein
VKRYVALLAAGFLLVGCEGGSTPTPAPSPSSPASASATAADVALVHRAAHTMTDLGPRGLLVAGGCVVDGCATATPTAYLVGPASSEAVADMGTPRDGHTATLLTDGRVLVVGGFSGEGQPPLATAEVFDPEADTWQQVGDLAVARGGHAAALLGDGRVLVAGGWVSSGTYTASTEIFDPASGELTSGPDLPQAVDGLAATTLADGSVLVAGGQSAPGVASDLAVRVFADGSASRAGSLRRARFKHALVTLPSGTALAIGGTSDDERLLRSTEVYDPAADRFGPGPTLRGGRYKLAGSAAVMADGRVVVAGGGPGVEVLDPRTGRSTQVPGGPSWASFSTVGVVGPRLRVIGGYDQQIRLTDTDLSVALSDL